MVDHGVILQMMGNKLLHSTAHKISCGVMFPLYMNHNHLVIKESMTRKLHHPQREHVLPSKTQPE